MINKNVTQTMLDNISAPIRQIEGKAELYGSSAATYEGNVITVNDVCPKPHEAHVQLKPKNLFNVYAVVGHTKIINNLDGTLSIVNTASNTVATPDKLRNLAPSLEVGKTYTLSAVTTSSKKYIYLGAPTSQVWNFGASRTITEDNLNSPVSFYGDGDGTTTTISNIQIEEGVVASAYTPYIYSPKEDEGNLLNKDTIVIGGVGYSTGQLATTNTNMRTDSYSIEPNTIYYVYTGPYILNTVHVYDADGVWIGRAQMSSSTSATNNPAFFTPENAASMRLTYRKSDSSAFTAEELEAFKQENLYISKVAGLPYLKTDFSDTKVYRYGKNLWDEQWELGIITSVGLNSNSTNSIRSKNYIPLLKGQTYFLDFPQMAKAFWFDADKKLLRVSNPEHGDITITNEAYMRFHIGGAVSGTDAITEYNNNICISLGGGEYEPYVEPIEVAASADGKVTMPSQAPTMTLFNNYGLPMTVNCLRAAKVTYANTDLLKSFKVERISENKFFGYGICQKATISLLDKERKIGLTDDNYFSLLLGHGDDYISPFPFMYLDETKRDEITNELTITAYDALYAANRLTVADLELESYTIREFAAAAAKLLDVGFEIIGVNDESFDTLYEDGANFDGSESLREALDSIAEATQTIYFISGNNLTFKRLDSVSTNLAVLTIGKDKYFDLQNQEPVMLKTICSATELGDNLEADYNALSIRGSWRWNDEISAPEATIDERLNFTSFGNPYAPTSFVMLSVFPPSSWADTQITYSYPAGWDSNGDGDPNNDFSAELVVNGSTWTYEDYKTIDFGALPQPITLEFYNYLMANATPINGVITNVEGVTQYVRDNPFWELREDVATLLHNAVEAIGGLSIHQFNCSWRGNYLLEIGDKIEFVTKDDSVITTFFVDDVLEYNGALSQVTKFEYGKEEESFSNPTSLGDVVKQTYAKVDKANKEISLLASETALNSENISNLTLNTTSISASVRAAEERTNTRFENVDSNIESLVNQVNASMTSEAVKFEIQKELSNGVNKVVTNTGYMFDDKGLTVSKSDSEMTTQITEDGMTVYRIDDAVLEANNTGVKAQNLHATTYLIIGDNSRFEDRGNRTVCFWIGGN